MKNFKLTTVIDANCGFIYKFFLDSKLHGEVTGSPAQIDCMVGGKFQAWDQYISGEITELEKDKHIAQKWRTTDFSDVDMDSIVEIDIQEMPGGRSRMTLKHSGLPEGTEAGYKEGWRDYYIKPLKEYIKKTSGT